MQLGQDGHLERRTWPERYLSHSLQAYGHSDFLHDCSQVHVTICVHEASSLPKHLPIPPPSEFSHFHRDICLLSSSIHHAGRETSPNFVRRCSAENENRAPRKKKEKSSQWRKSSDKEETAQSLIKWISRSFSVPLTQFMVMQFFTPRLHCKPIKIMFSLDVGFHYRMSWQRKTLIKVSHFAKALSSLNVDTYRAEPGFSKSTVLLFRPCSSAPRPSVCLIVLQSG